MDLAGAVTLTAAMLGLVLTIERASHASLAWTASALAVSGLLLAAFVAVERRAVTPLVRLGVLRSGALLRANLAGLLYLGAFYGFQFIVVLYLQELRGWSTLATSLALLVICVDIVLAPTVTPMLVRRFGNPRVILAGLILATAAYALFLPVQHDWAYAAMLPALLLLGVAFALVYGPLTIAATDGVDDREQGLASGLIYTSIQFGAALGLAAVTAAYVAVTSADPTPQTLLDGYRAALVVPLAAVVLAAAVTALGLRRRTPAAAAPATDALPTQPTPQPVTRTSR